MLAIATQSLVPPMVYGPSSTGDRHLQINAAAPGQSEALTAVTRSAAHLPVGKAEALAAR